MALAEPLRGEVWDVDFVDSGLHPAAVMSVNPMNTRLGHVAVIPITGTPGPALTHVPLGAEVGLTKYDVSFADVAALQPVARTDVMRLRGRLGLGALERIETQLRVYLAL